MRRKTEFYTTYHIFIFTVEPYKREVRCCFLV
jgi:hypothetical protein